MGSGLLTLARTLLSPSLPLDLLALLQPLRVEAVHMASLFRGSLLFLTSVEPGVPGVPPLERRLLRPPWSLSASAWLPRLRRKAGVKP